MAGDQQTHPTTLNKASLAIIVSTCVIFATLLAILLWHASREQNADKPMDTENIPHVTQDPPSGYRTQHIADQMTSKVKVGKPPVRPYREPIIPSPAVTLDSIRLKAPPKLPQVVHYPTVSKHISTQSKTPLNVSQDISLRFANTRTPSGLGPLIAPPSSKTGTPRLPASDRDTQISMRTDPPTPPPKSGSSGFPLSSRDSRGYVRMGPTPPPKDGPICVPSSRRDSPGHKRTRPPTPLSIKGVPRVRAADRKLVVE
ncbi:MAG: hypothetical protein M1835_000310 [Candelina submexicana]|nr:MAG: hypothetical protein M1835_000310 [Candelina submexicana]